MTASDYAALRASVQAHEGLRLSPYCDTTGHATIGYGHRMVETITEAQADALLDEDLQTALMACGAHIPVFLTLDGTRQRVLVEMAFNLGIRGLLGFPKMLAAVQAGDYATAATEMRQSLWLQQVGSRVMQLADLMQTGDPAVTT